MTTFTGFGDEALAFYDGLEADNSRDYWQANKSAYEHEVKEPMLALLDGLEEEFGPAKMFRPNRDIRFSTDKSPYKTHTGAFVGQSTGVGYYVQLSADGLAAGGGFRAHGPSETARMRAAVDAPATGQVLTGELARLTSAGFEILGDRVKTTPRGYPADHPRIETLRLKEAMLLRRFGAPDWLGTAQALEQVRATWRELRPCVDWFVANVEE